MRKLIVIIILLIIPIALKAQVSAEERQVEYQLSVAPTIAFKMPYHVARPDIMGHYDRALGFVVDFDVRTNVNKYLYAGGEFSLSTFLLNYAQPIPCIQFNFAPTIKGILPIKEKCSLFSILSIGTTATMLLNWGLYLHCGIGVEVRRFSLSLGYRGYANRAMDLDESRVRLANSTYLQFGVRLGRI